MLALNPKLDEELDSMLADGIIVPVEKSIDRVHLLLVREKPNGSLRSLFGSQRPEQGNQEGTLPCTNS